MRVLRERYELGEQLGTGIARGVYRATDLQEGRVVTVKLLEGLVSDDPGYARRYDAEVERSAALSHPNIVPIYDAYLNDYGSGEPETCYFVTEYLPGSVAGYLAEHGPLDEQGAGRLMAPVLEALSVAHDAGLTHGYLKPANVLLTEDGVAQLADLGIAKAVSARIAMLAALNDSSQPVRSFDYASPEQVRGEAVTPASDLYAAGVILYELLAGRRPFEAEDPMKVSFSHLFEQPQPLVELAPGVSPNMVLIVQRAMAKEPELRFVDAREMLGALTAAVGVVEHEEDTERFFAGYKLGHFVGRGGFAKVYRTSRGSRDPELCIKIGDASGGGSRMVTRLPQIPEEPTSRGLSPDELIAEGRFEDTGGVSVHSVSAEDVRTVLESEFSLLENLQTDLLPSVFDVGESRGAPYYVMEHIPGPTLRELLRNRDELDINPLHVFAHLLEDLLAVQGSDPGFYHGDIKPENMLLAGERLRLIDPALRTSGDGELSGTLTLAYNPLALRGEAADTFAISTVMFELMTEQQPFLDIEQPIMLNRSAMVDPSTNIPQPAAIDPSIQHDQPMDIHLPVHIEQPIAASAEEGSDSEEAARLRAAALGLDRYSSYRGARLAGQLLEWMASPPTYATMHETLVALRDRKFEPPVEPEPEPEADAALETADDYPTMIAQTPQFEIGATILAPALKFLSLHATTGPTAGQTFTVGPAGGVVGRMRENEVSIPDGRLSRRHASIEYRDGGYWLSDLGSSNGTWVNGARITEPHQLHTGDVMQLGETRLTATVEDLSG